MMIIQHLKLDSAKENDIGLGRELYLPELKENECYVSTTLSDALKLGIGDKLQMKISLSELLQAYSSGGGQGSEEEDEYEPQNKNMERGGGNNDNNNNYHRDKGHNKKNQNSIYYLKDEDDFSGDDLFDDDFLDVSELYTQFDNNN